jgi:hypothetical protein
MERPDAEDEPSAKRVKTDDNEEGEIEAPAPSTASAAPRLLTLSLITRLLAL